MRVPTYGSSAYKYERDERTRKSSRVKPKIKKTRHIAFKDVFAYAVITLLAFTLLFRYACITEMTARLAKLKEEYNKAQSVVVAKEFEMEQNIDLRKVEEIATTELGMQRPEKHQIVYIDMKNSDYTESTVVKEDKGGFFASLAGTFKRVWEYFG